MTYQNDPAGNVRRPEDKRVANENNTTMWIGGAVALAAVIAIAAYSMSDNNTSTATNTNRPVATERSTTGSGATTTPAITQRAPSETTGSGAASPQLNTGRANTDQGNPASGVQTSPLAKPEARQPGSAPATNR